MGSARSTAVAKFRSTLVSLGSPFGIAWTRARPSGNTQSLTRSGGSVLIVTIWGAKLLRN